MKEKIKELKQFQDELEKQQAKKKIIVTKHKLDLEEIVEKIDKCNNQIEKLKSEIDKEVVKQFNESGEKNFYGGISVKEYDVIKYSDEDAEKWCKEHDMFFVWDKKSFDKTVKSLKLDFVKIDKEPKATFPKEIKLEESITDLNKAMEDGSYNE